MKEFESHEVLKKPKLQEVLIRKTQMIYKCSSYRSRCTKLPPFIFAKGMPNSGKGEMSPSCQHRHFGCHYSSRPICFVPNFERIRIRWVRALILLYIFGSPHANAGLAQISAVISVWKSVLKFAWKAESHRFESVCGQCFICRQNAERSHHFSIRRAGDELHLRNKHHLNF